MIVGTAGHIDHGKTSLVRALTGVDTDRLKEEKARGISIDLGFAYLPAPRRRRSSASSTCPATRSSSTTCWPARPASTSSLLVVAADDGVMPQTREHLAIVDLLGLERGVVALTKSDLVDAERRERGRPPRSRSRSPAPRLAGGDIVPVSAVTGEGVDDLRERSVRWPPRRSAARAADGRFRLAVDRSFTLAGRRHRRDRHRAVGQRSRSATASPISPSGLSARVRSIHAQNRAAERGRAGERCALNLAGDGIAQGRDSRAATSCSIPSCMRRPTASMRRCACWHRETEAGRRNGCRCGCITPRPRSARASCCSATSRSRPASEALRAARAGAADRGRGRRPLRAARHLGAAHHRRRPFPRSARAGAQAAHAGAARATRRACARPIRSRRWPRCSTRRRASSTWRPSRATARWRPTRCDAHRRAHSACLRSPARRHCSRCRPPIGCGLKRSLLATLRDFHADNPDLPGIGPGAAAAAARAAPAGAGLPGASARACATAARLRSTAPGCGCRAMRCGSRRRTRSSGRKIAPAARRRRALPSAARARHRRHARRRGSATCGGC